MVGKILDSAASIIRGVTFDAHHSHGYYRDALFGIWDRITPNMIAEKEIDFFKDCKFESLPPHALPHFPMQLLKHSSGYIWPLPGACVWEWII